MSHEIDKQSLSIFFARKCDFWSQWSQWIYIEFYRYPQAIAWNYMNFNRYPHIGRGPTCRWQSSSVKPLRLHSMHFTRAFLFIHWRRCKLLASMWVSRRVSYWNSVCEFVLQLPSVGSIWECSMGPTLVSIRECSFLTPGHSWTPCSLFVEADIDCFGEADIDCLLKLTLIVLPVRLR